MGIAFFCLQRFQFVSFVLFADRKYSNERHEQDKHKNKSSTNNVTENTTSKKSATAVMIVDSKLSEQLRVTSRLHRHRP